MHTQHHRLTLHLCLVALVFVEFLNLLILLASFHRDELLSLVFGKFLGQHMYFYILKLFGFELKLQLHIFYQKKQITS